MKKILLLLLLCIPVAAFSNLIAAESSPQFIQGADTLVVYTDVPGLAPSDKYTIRVRSAATSNVWVDVFANYTYNRAAELANIPVGGPDGHMRGSVVQAYAVHTKNWSHAYGNIEMNEGQAVEIEIAAKNGFKIGGKDFFKATVHPAQKASAATVTDGKIYCTITKPAQIYIDINGQMDDHNAAINPIGHPVHAISIFANPVIKTPSLTGSKVRTIEPGTGKAAINAIRASTYDTMYFKPGVHDIGSGIKMHPGKTYYIPGDAFIYGTFNNIGVPAGSFSRNGENIKVYGYGTVCGTKIPNYEFAYYYPDLKVDGPHPFEIENEYNSELFGVAAVDNADHTVRGGWSFKWVKTITWRANGDGLGGGYAEDCFIRTQDDCSYIGNKKRCTYWKDANAALFHMSLITETGKVVIEDCDVLYARLRENPGYNGGGFQARGSGALGVRNVDVTFRNFRFHDKLINMPVFSLESGTDGPSFKGLLFQNITIAGMAPGNKQRIEGSAKAPWYGGLIFDKVTIGGTKITADNHKTFINTNEYVNYLLFAMPKNVTFTATADAAQGSVSRNPDKDTLLETSTVLLTATGNPGYVFSHWSGDVTGKSNPVSVIIDKDMSVTANFTLPDFSAPIVIDAPGSGSFTVPEGISSVTVKVWGAGGAGGSASNGATGVQSRGGGGAGGGFAMVKKPVTAGHVLSYTLGAGGKAAPLGFTSRAVDVVQNGGTSRVLLNSEVIALAQGGPGGQNIADAFDSGSGGGAPQKGNVGDSVFYGGNGGNASSNGTGGGGGSAGALGNGGNGEPFNAGSAGAGGGAEGGKGVNMTDIGYPGKVPGAGGSGAAVRASAHQSKQGGDGSNGRIVFYFNVGTGIKRTDSGSNRTIDIYANQATGKLLFNPGDKVISKIQLLDVTGKVVYSTVVQRNKGTVDLTGIAKGVYLVKMYTNTDIVIKKITLK